MPRTSQSTEKRRQLLPLLARAFTRLGYRGATTAALAKECAVQENILYRLWRDKKAMFLAAIDFVYEFSERTWLAKLNHDPRRPGSISTAQKLLEYESRHHGEFGHYRIIFTGLAECDDHEIRDSLRRMLERFHRFLAAQIVAHRRAVRADNGLSSDLAAWAIIGVATVANIGRELEILSTPRRKRLIADAGRKLLADGA